jgi:hypothetical protein
MGPSRVAGGCGGMKGSSMNGAEATEILAAAARRYAHAQDALGALSCLWWANLRTLDSILHEAWSEATRHEWFTVWEEIIAAIDGNLDEVTSLANLADSRRHTILSVMNSHGIEVPPSKLPALDVGEDLPVPSEEELAAAVRRRLGDVSEEEFIAARRRESVDEMIKSQCALAEGDLTGAITHAYDSDMAAVDAYLVDSAKAAGDRHLTSWIARWELVSAAIARVPALPRDLGAASATVRTCISEALGEPDASRLLATLQRV